MKKTSILVLALVAVLGFSGVAGATLYNRGNGLIYDDHLNITWLQDANYAKTSGYDADGKMTWDEAKAWADQLVYGGHNDWRLPTTVDGLYVFGWDGTTTGGFNITSSEMGYMYYMNLGNKGQYATDGTYPQNGWGLNNVSFTDGATGNPRSFENLEAAIYWSGTEYSFNAGANVGRAWGFDFNSGWQIMGNTDSDHFAWAVRDGDVAAPAVPEPATMLLLASGLAGLGAFRKRIGWRRG